MMRNSMPRPPGAGGEYFPPVPPDPPRVYPAGAYVAPLPPMLGQLPDPPVLTELEPLAEISPAVEAAIVAKSEGATVVTFQDLVPAVVGLIRSLIVAVPVGAAGGALIVLKTGNYDSGAVLWGALIGALTGFVGRNSEAIGLDQLLGKSRTVRTDGSE